MALALLMVDLGLVEYWREGALEMEEEMSGYEVPDKRQPDYYIGTCRRTFWGTVSNLTGSGSQSITRLKLSLTRLC